MEARRPERQLAEREVDLPSSQPLQEAASERARVVARSERSEAQLVSAGVLPAVEYTHPLVGHQVRYGGGRYDVVNQVSGHLILQNLEQSPRPAGDPIVISMPAAGNPRVRTLMLQSEGLRQIASVGTGNSERSFFVRENSPGQVYELVTTGDINQRELRLLPTNEIRLVRMQHFAGVSPPVGPPRVGAEPITERPVIAPREEAVLVRPGGTQPRTSDASSSAGASARGGAAEAPQPGRAGASAQGGAAEVPQPGRAMAERIGSAEAPQPRRAVAEPVANRALVGSDVTYGATLAERAPYTVLAISNDGRYIMERHGEMRSSAQTTQSFPIQGNRPDPQEFTPIRNSAGQERFVDRAGGVYSVTRRGSTYYIESDPRIETVSPAALAQFNQADRAAERRQLAERISSGRTGGIDRIGAQVRSGEVVGRVVAEHNNEVFIHRPNAPASAGRVQVSSADLANYEQVLVRPSGHPEVRYISRTPGGPVYRALGVPDAGSSVPRFELVVDHSIVRVPRSEVQPVGGSAAAGQPARVEQTTRATEQSTSAGTVERGATGRAGSSGEAPRPTGSADAPRPTGRRGEVSPAEVARLATQADGARVESNRPGQTTPERSARELTAEQVRELETEAARLRRTGDVERARGIEATVRALNGEHGEAHRRAAHNRISSEVARRPGGGGVGGAVAVGILATAAMGYYLSEQSAAGSPLRRPTVGR